MPKIREIILLSNVEHFTNSAAEKNIPQASQARQLLKTKKSVGNYARSAFHGITTKKFIVNNARHQRAFPTVSMSEYIMTSMILVEIYS